MVPKLKRDPELMRLYVAVGLGVLIWAIFSAYKVLSAQVDAPIDAPSRWALLALGLANVLAIGTLLFIVARSVAKLYFERRSGILGSRLRTRLVLALLAVGIAPSLMLFLVGRNFISKNVDRWFRPETQEMIKDSRRISESLREALTSQVSLGLKRVVGSNSQDLTTLRKASGLDLLELVRPGKPPHVSLGRDLEMPPQPPDAKVRQRIETPGGIWFLETQKHGQGWYRAGVFLPRKEAESLMRLERRDLEASQIESNRDALETLPQSTFLFLTLLSLFAAVWIGLTISRTISEPVRALAKAAQRIGTGDLDVALTEEGSDELAFLAHSFNMMTRDLKQGRIAIEAQSERIERQRQYLNQLLEALPVGVMSWQEDGELRTFNPAARHWLGLEGQDPGQPAWQDLKLQPRMGILPSLVEEVQQSRRTLQEEFRIGGEGEGRPVRAMILPLTQGGVLAVLEDLSLLAQAEKRAAWQEVARRMAHEVKNPLTPIKLTAQRLLRRSHEGRLETSLVAEATETILAEVASLANLVDSFSRFAKLPAPQPTRLEACELVRQVASLYASARPGIRLETLLPEHGVEVRWDADMIKRALINLVDNAIGAIDGAGTVQIALVIENRDIHLKISDTGSGVPERDRPRLFQPYFSTKKKGTGLGLAIVRRIAQDHGGDAEYEPLPQGSLFRLILPLEPTLKDH